MNINEDLRVAEVAKIANCHPLTVRNRERKGDIEASRDLNNHRRFSVEQALRLRDLLTTRIHNQQKV